MSKSQLARKLNALSGLSPNDFLKEFKLRKAIALMEDQNMNIAEVTMAIGFSNPSYFTKCFRKRFGKALPTIWLPIDWVRSLACAKLQTIGSNEVETG